MSDTEPRRIKWPNPHRLCRCGGTGFRELAWHHTDCDGRARCDTFAAACPDCDLGRACSMERQDTTATALRDDLSGRSGTLRVVMDPGPKDCMVPTGAKATTPRPTHRPEDGYVPTGDDGIPY
jgi:hypothetical protein